MFLQFLLALCSCDYVEITKDNVDKYIGGPVPIFVKFYSPQCGHCREMAEDFSEASTYFQKDVLFGGVDCLAQNPICDAHKVEGFPTIKLFKAHSKEGTEYNGDRSADLFVSYVQTNTGAKTHKQLSILTYLNPFNYAKTIKENKCVFVMFYANWDSSSKHFLPQLKEAANAFEGEPNISVGAVNCDNYHEICQNNSVSDYPTMLLLKKNQQVPFKSEQSVQNVVTMINDYCGTKRSTNGLLMDSVGIVKDANPIVDEFNLAIQENNVEKRDQAIEKMKKIPGADVYAKAMERIISKGLDVLAKDLVIMNNFMTEKKGSIKALDGMKMRYNVFKLFVPPSHSKDKKGTEKSEL